MGQLTDEAWSRIWYSIPVTLKNGMSQIITAKQIKEHGNHIEPRIACHFDTSKKLPKVMVKTHTFPLPVKNGQYIIVKGKGFHKLEEINDKPKDFVSLMGMSINSLGGSGESKFLAYADNSGLISHFLNRGEIFKWDEGRQYTNPFDFYVDDVGPIHQESVQIQVDGLFIQENYACVMEAKSRPIDDFIIRQLYYPYRQWKINFEVVDPVFLIVEPEQRIYRFWQYRFANEENYSSIELVRSAIYRIIEEKRDSSEIEKVETNTDLGWNVPQADDFEKIAKLPLLVNMGLNDSVKLSDAMDFHVRQSSYYSQACEFVGLIERVSKGRGFKYQLTEIGRDYINSPQPKRIEILAKLLMSVPSMKLIYDRLNEISNQKSPQYLTSKDIAVMLGDVSNLSGKTPYRRAKTIFSWFKWLGEKYGVVKIVNKRYLTLQERE